MNKIHTLEQFENAKRKTSIILFTADWCPDCMFIKPYLDELITNNPEFSFYQVNRDEMIDLCIELDIIGIPSFLCYQNGNELNRFVSKFRKTKEEIQDFINESKKKIM